MGKSARAKFNMLLLSIKDEQLQNILFNKYLNSSAQEKNKQKKKHVAYPLITSVSRGSERQLFDANKQTRQTRWAHYRRAKAPSRDTQPLYTPPSPPSLLLYLPLPLSLSLFDSFTYLPSHFAALRLPLFLALLPSPACFSSQPRPTHPFHFWINTLLFSSSSSFANQKQREKRNSGVGAK